MTPPEQRAVLFVVERANTAVELVNGLFAARDELGRRRRRADQLEPLSRSLCDEGYQVGLLVAGTDSGGQLARSPRPDVVVAEVSSAEGASLAVARDLRRMYPNLPVFVITSLVDLAARSCAQLSPAPIVFTQPLDYSCFSVALGRAAKQHRGEYLKIPSFLLDGARGAYPEQN